MKNKYIAGIVCVIVIMMSISCNSLETATTTAVSNLVTTATTPTATTASNPVTTVYTTPTSAILQTTLLTATTTSATPAVSVIGHGYYPELPEFTFALTDDPNSTEPYEVPLGQVSFDAAFVKMTTSMYLRESKTALKSAYIFKKPETGETVYLLMPLNIVDNLNLISDEVYQITYRIEPGWPFIYGLNIKKNGELILAAISSSINSKIINVDWLLPFQVTQNRILENNYLAGTDTDIFIRETNTELAFTGNGETVYLHQGQSVIANGYTIKLLVARDTQLKGWPDGTQNGLSCVIWKNK